jgi:hypothetical protein
MKVMSLDTIKEKIEKICSENFIHHNKIDALLDTWWKNKKHLCEALNLTEENDFRWIMKNDLTLKDRVDIFNFMKSLACRSKYDIHDFGTVLHGKNVIKLGKIFPKVCDRIGASSALTQLLNAIGMSNVRSNFDMLHQGKQTTESLEKTIHQFLVKYGDYVKMGRGLVLSANPLDMFTASHNSTYKSCMRPGGEYFNGVISHVISPDVLIAFVQDVSSIEKKVGRQWIYANKTLYWGGRWYGAYYETDAEVIRSRVLRNPYFEGEWESASHGLSKNDVDRDQTWIYLDYDYTTVWKKKGAKQKNFQIMTGPCLSCGKPLDHARDGNCQECLRKFSQRCDICGEKIKESDKYAWMHPHTGVTYHYHYNCFEAYKKKCIRCAHWFSQSFILHGIYMKENGSRKSVDICHECNGNENHSCGFCGSYWVREDIEIYNNKGHLHNICPKCIDDKKGKSICFDKTSGQWVDIKKEKMAV